MRKAAAGRQAMAYSRFRIVRARHDRQDTAPRALRSSRLLLTTRERRAREPQLVDAWFFPTLTTYSSSWPGLSRPSTSFFWRYRRTWMPGTSPGMTILATFRFELRRPTAQ